MKKRKPDSDSNGQGRGLVVPRAGDGETLLTFLAERLGLSRRAAKGLLDRRCVFVNRRRVWMAHHILAAGDRIDVADRPRAGKTPSASLDVLFRDEHYVVANKQPGMLSNGPDSAETALRAHLRLPSLQAVHRLDRDTSGCLLLAADARAFDAAVGVFKRRDVRKTYHAIVQGKVPPALRRIDTPVNGRPALTLVRTLSARAAASHLLLTLETGRTHQIRRHLTMAGHPLLGDKQYGTRREATEAAMAVPRQMLHASSLRLESPLTGRAVAAHAPLPRDFTDALRRFGLR